MTSGARLDFGLDWRRRNNLGVLARGDVATTVCVTISL